MSRSKTFGAKSKFIREHSNLSAKEVVAKGAEAGLKILPQQVYKLRSADNAKGNAAKKAGGSTKAGTKKFGAKSDFVRSQPSTMSAKEIVAAAKAAGMLLTEGLVYNLRSKKKAAKKPGSKPTAVSHSGAHGGGARRGRGRPRGAKAPAVTNSSGEAELLRAIAGIGLDRARELFDRVEQAINSVG